MGFGPNKAALAMVPRDCVHFDRTGNPISNRAPDRSIYSSGVNLGFNRSSFTAG